MPSKYWNTITYKMKMLPEKNKEVHQTSNLITSTVYEVMSKTEVEKCNATLDFLTSVCYSIKSMEKYELNAKI